MGQMILTIDTTQPEDRRYVQAIARILTELYPDNPPRLVNVIDPMEQLRPPEGLSQEQSAKTAGEEALTAKQQQAAKARAAKAEKAAKAAAEAETAERLAAAERASDEAVANGHDNGDALFGDESDPTTSLSPAEALDAGVALIRRVYQAGHTDAVRDVTKAWGVVKFREIPVERGHDFHREIVALAEKLGVR